MLFGTNLKYTKAYNYRIVLETVRLQGPISRADVARSTELTPQTVSNIARRLIKANLIMDTDRTREGRGAPATNLEINPDGAFSIGLDFDQDHLTGVMIDLKGVVRERVDYSIRLPMPDVAMDHMEQVVRHLITQHSLQRRNIWGVGIGLPGPLEIEEGSVVAMKSSPSALGGWDHVPVADLMSRRLDLPIYLENNATAAAIGERWYGEGREFRTFFYLFFGLGLGGGLIIDGHPYEGNSGNAGEIGYVPTAFPKDHFESFEYPHLGIYFNLPRLYRMLEEAGIRVSDIEDLVQLHSDGNPIVADWISTGGSVLASIVPAIGYLLDPEAIVFGGRLPDQLIDVLMARVRQALPEAPVAVKSIAPKLRRGRAGRDATALGVATLPMYESFAPAPNILMKSSGNGGERPFLSVDQLLLRV